jgi:hypothetical protein
VTDTPARIVVSGGATYQEQQLERRRHAVGSGHVPKGLQVRFAAVQESALGLGCGKTFAREEGAELYSVLLLATAIVDIFVF